MMFLLDLLRLILSGRRGTDLDPRDPYVLDPVPPLPTEPDPVSPIPPTEPVDLEEEAEPVLDPLDPGPEPDPAEYGSATLLVRAMKEKGYRVFEDNFQDYNLNIVAVRDPAAIVDRFSCKICVFWKDPAGEWNLIEWGATTYPGSRYLVERLLNPAGAAILCPGQYPVYRLDVHNGKYRALCQRRGPVRVYRDGDRDREFDLLPSSVMSGMFGINVHAPVTPSSGLRTYVAQRVYAASAGCQVFRSLSDFLEFRALCEKAAELWGNAFTLTLLDEDDLISVDQELPSSPPDPIQIDQLETWDPPFDSVGVRHRNLLNVKQNPADPWRFSIGQDGKGHTIFPSFPKGLRAGIINLRSYWTRHKLRTIAAILSRWAPSSDTIGSIKGAPANSPKDYSDFVAGRMGLEPVSPLSLFTDSGEVRDRDQLFEIVSAIAAYENDADLDLPRDVFDEALRLL